MPSAHLESARPTWASHSTACRTPPGRLSERLSAWVASRWLERADEPLAKRCARQTSRQFTTCHDNLRHFMTISISLFHWHLWQFLSRPRPPVPFWISPVQAHLCGPFYNTSRDNCVIPQKTSNEWFCDTISTSIVRYEKHRCCAFNLSSKVFRLWAAAFLC